MLCMDGTIPRHALPDVLDRIAELSEQYKLICCNVFHAGDGNLHPLIAFDCMKPGELERAEAFGADILKLCVAKGGVLALMRAIAQEEREHQVRANPVAPGTLRTGANTKAVPSATPMVDLESVVQAVRFLAGADARQVTGQLIELAP